MRVEKPKLKRLARRPGAVIWRERVIFNASREPAPSNLWQLATKRGAQKGRKQGRKSQTEIGQAPQPDRHLQILL